MRDVPGSHVVDKVISSRTDRRKLLQGAAALTAATAGIGAITGQAALGRQATEPAGALQLGGESQPAGTWLPYRASGGAETQVFDMIFSRLIRFDADYNLIPDLAETFEINDDASEFTFNLRQNVT